MIEAVALHGAAADLREGILEEVFYLHDVHAVPRAHGHIEIQYPIRTAGTGGDFVRPRAQYPQTHALEHGQDVGERHGLFPAENFEAQQFAAFFERAVQMGGERLIDVDAFQPLNVEHRAARGKIVAIGGGKRIPVTLMEPAAGLLAQVFMEGAAQDVLPGQHGLHHAGLQLGDIVVGQMFGTGADDEMHPRQRRFGNLDVELRALSVEGAQQNVLDAAAQVGVITVARHVDQRGDETAEQILAHEESEAMAFLHLEDAGSHFVQFLFGELKHFIARKRVEDMHQRFAAVTGGRISGMVDDVLNFFAQDGNVAGPRAVSQRAVEAEEAPLADHLARVVVAFDAEIIEMHRAMHRGDAGGFGDDEQSGHARQRPQRRRNVGEALRFAHRVVAVVAQHSQARAGDVEQQILALLVHQVIGAEADESEVMVVHPAQKM